MAIRKNAKNISIRGSANYNLTVGGKLEKIADKINYRSKKEKYDVIKQ